MRPFDDIDELHGDPGLRAFVDDVRAYASGPLPAVRPDLAAVFTAGIGADATRHGPEVARPAPADTALQRLGNRLQRRRGRLTLGASVLSLTFLGTGAVGALPGPAQTAFERTADVVGIELPEEARRDEAPVLSEPVTGEPRDQDEPVEGQEAPQPLDEREPDPLPVDGGSERPAPSNPPGAGEGRPEESGGAGAPGDDLSREARERVPPSVPGPVAPRPVPPGTVPGGPPADPPGGGRSEGGGDKVDEDEAGEDHEREGEGGEGLGRGATASPTRPPEAGRRTF